MLGKLFPFLLGIQVTFRGRTVVNFLGFFCYFLGPKSRGRNWRTQSWVDPRSVGNLANARANANATGTLQRGHGSEERNPPWLLWSCCDVEFFADILPILFGYGLEMSEKKRVFRNMREEKLFRPYLGGISAIHFSVWSTLPALRSLQCDMNS